MQAYEKSAVSFFFFFFFFFRGVAGTPEGLQGLCNLLRHVALSKGCGTTGQERSPQRNQEESRQVRKANRGRQQ